MIAFPQNTELNSEPFYPKVLICSLSRINKRDTSNNSLLWKNLFAEWPRERLAQIYYSGSNNDEGFCGQQYQISAHDRKLGKLFVLMKGLYPDDSLPAFTVGIEAILPGRRTLLARLKLAVGRFIRDSGFYELIFRVKPSKQLFLWVEKFAPDIILAQGHCLQFIQIPLMIKHRLRIPIAFYCTDDWPSYLYASRKGLLAVTAPIMRRIVSKSVRQLMDETNVPFSFNTMMGEEYERRYGKPFTPLMHCDDPDRFRLAEPIRLHPPEVKSIVATGIFGDFRWPLLLDLEEVCRRLNKGGILVQATVLVTNISVDGYRRVKDCQFVSLKEDPGHEKLPSYLKGADLLFLPETFDPITAQGYRYSISTKAHLFMFSRRPIIVYGHPANGLVLYAQREGWARVVDCQNIDMLEDAFRILLTDIELQQRLVADASAVVMRNNNCTTVREVFHSHLNTFLTSNTTIQREKMHCANRKVSH